MLQAPRATKATLGLRARLEPLERMALLELLELMAQLAQQVQLELRAPLDQPVQQGRMALTAVGRLPLSH